MPRTGSKKQGFQSAQLYPTVNGQEIQEHQGNQPCPYGHRKRWFCPMGKNQQPKLHKQANHKRNHKQLLKNEHRINNNKRQTATDIFI